jgi:hypothetical protein
MKVVRLGAIRLTLTHRKEKESPSAIGLLGVAWALWTLKNKLVSSGNRKRAINKKKSDSGLFKIYIGGGNQAEKGQGLSRMEKDKLT